jgi:hypothetical protein
MVSVLAEIETPIREGKRMGRKASETVNVTVEMKLPKGVADVLIGNAPSLPGQICKFSNSVILDSHARDSAFLYQNLPDNYQAQVPAEREEAARVLDFAREVMHTILEHRGITQEQFERLAELKTSHVIKLFPVHAANEKGILFCGHLFKVANGGIFATLAADIVQFLDRLIKYDFSRLLQCPVCKTLFVRDEDKPTQKYDCHACQNLDSVRRHREKKSQDISQKPLCK